MGAALTVEIMTSRSYEFSQVEATNFLLLTAWIADSVGIWQGKLLGFVSFMAEEAVFHEVQFEDPCATHKRAPFPLRGTSQRSPKLPACTYWLGD